MDEQTMNYRSYTDLAQCIRRNIDKIPGDAELVVGVPRSGLLAALMISKYRNIPVISLEAFLSRERPVSGSYSLPDGNEKDLSSLKKVLVIDDSICSGRSFAETKSRIREADFEGIEFVYCAIYYVSECLPLIDIGLEQVDMPRFFEWNIFEHAVLEQACVDIDGVVCRDPTEAENDDGEKYLSFIQNVPPRFIPFRGCVVSCFVSTRLEKYRPQTEAWLKRHFPFKELVMLDLPSKAERQRLKMYGKFKAEVYKNRPETLFIESDMTQALEIARLSGKEVFCTATMTLIKPDDLKDRPGNCPLPAPSSVTVKAQRKKLPPFRFLRKAAKYLLPYGMIRQYQKRKYGRDFSPLDGDR